MVWNIDKKQRILVLPGHKAAVHSVTFSVCGRVLATGSKDCSVRMWNVEPYTQQPEGKGASKESNDVTIKRPASMNMTTSGQKEQERVKAVSDSAALYRQNAEAAELLISVYRTAFIPVFTVQFSTRNLMLVGGRRETFKM